MPLEWITCKVEKIINETPTVKRFWLAFEHSFQFTAGQFITFDLPISEKKNKRMKSYSIASAPDGGNIIELVIVVVPEGEGGSLFLFNEVEVGSVLTVRGPIGLFVLPEVLPNSIYLIATGTGIAPFRSFILDLKNKGILYTSIHLLFGTRTEADLLYYNEMKELSATLINFHYTPVLSRADAHWQGERGYVHTAYERLCAAQPDAIFYLCGWKNMIDEARQRIANLGYSKEAVHFEIYG